MAQLWSLAATSAFGRPCSSSLLVVVAGALVWGCAGQTTWNVQNMLSDMGCGTSCTYDNGNQIMNWFGDSAITPRPTTCDFSTEYKNVLAKLGQCVSCTDQAIYDNFGPGYYCDNNEVVLCPVGYYCPDYLTKTECPEGTWCKDGFVEALDCSPMVTCEAGAEMQKAGLGFLAALIFMIFLCCCCGCCMTIRKNMAQAAMKKAADSRSDEEEINLGADVKMNVPKLEIEFKELSMHLKSNGKCVLDRVTGKFPPSSLVALMGPSGGGKTTFMNALCGRSSYGDVTGDIFINGKPGGITNFPKMTGFVPQDDIMHADLTVSQNIYFNAKLRLPADTPDEKVVDHANLVVKTLGMDHIAHSLVGNAAKRGISGGQKKRVNIGMELAAMPAVIFMDEPTSGLDGAATIQLASCLAKLRRSGLLIVCVIHQPRWAVFEQFSHLLLLGAGGGEVYCGTTMGLEHYFTSLGFRMPQKENAADWMIDVVCGLSPKYKSPDSDELDVTFVAPQGLFDLWAEKHKGKEHPYEGEKIAHDAPIEKDRVTPGYFMQTYVFLMRECRRFDLSNFIISCALLFFTGCVFGTLVRSNVSFSYNDLCTQLSMSSILYYMICTINSRSIFGYERLEYTRDFSVGVSASAFWTAKMIFHLIAWFMYGLCYSLTFFYFQPVPAQTFGQFMWVYLLAGWYHMGLGIVFSVVFSSPTTSLLCCVFIPMSLDTAFSGGLILIKDMGPEIIFAALTCGRWQKPLLFVQEMGHFPEHTHSFNQVTKILDDYEFQFGDEGRGYLSLFLLGAAMRVWALINLLLLKYSEGTNCCSQIKVLISKWMSDAGFGALNKPKHGDIVEHGNVLQRNPSKQFQAKD